MENVQVALSTMLQAREVSFEPISPRYFTIIAIRWLIFLLAVLGGWTLIAGLNDIPLAAGLLIGGGLLVAAGIWLAVMKLSFKYRGIAVREYDVVFRTGFINITETLVPYNRVQHVKLIRGVFEKMFGLSALYIYTAAGGNHNLSIAGLKAADAEKIKSYIMDKVRIGEEVAGPAGDIQAAEASAEDQDNEHNREEDSHGNQ